MISLILPTYNEAANLPDLITEIRDALGDASYEIIIVDDDSPDRTWETAQRLGPPVRSIRRTGERGLSSAVIEGFHRAKGDMLVVMDADGQHDPRLILKMVDALKMGETMTVGSRYIEGGGVEGLSEARHFASRVATAFAHLVMEANVEDPMSGFFALRTETFRQIAPSLKPSGFKILLEILSWLPAGSTVFEVPLMFRKRRKGESKLSWRVEMQYFKQVTRLFLLGRGNKQWILFMLITAAMTLMLIPRAWDLRLLVLDANLRHKVPQEIRRIADEHGWILSDIDLQTIEKDRMTFVYRQHHRGEDPTECFTALFGTSQLLPCND